MKVNVLLVKKAQKGDQEAFIQLIQGYEIVLFNTARRFLREDQDVEDALQETVIAAYQKIKQLKNPQYFHTWLCQILINQCKKFLSKEEWLEEIGEVQIAPVASIDNQILVRGLLDNLTPSYRIPLVLYFYNGFTLKEISEILGEPLGTIKSRLSRGKKMLKLAIEDHEEGGC